MVAPEPDAMSSQGEAESSPPPGLKKISSSGGVGTINTNAFSLLGRQSSIYSLTLDEFQHTLCESGKNFGSMNMDEFLTSIWTADETHHNNNNHQNHASNVNSTELFSASAAAPLLTPQRQQSLSRQGSLTLPAPLCRKTVEEVWSEIHSKAAPTPPPSSQQPTSSSELGNNTIIIRNIPEDSATRQPTFGEMTLEDFLVKAGVVREHAVSPPRPQPPIPQLPPPVYSGGRFALNGGLFQNQHRQNQNQNQNQQRHHRDNNNSNNHGGLSPGGSSDGAEKFGGMGMEIGAVRGRKRMMGDGPVEKVVERRQRRMIKNRESAARSRARKQAYTVELEAELNQLREENTHLKQTLSELERKHKQQYFEEMKMKVHTKAYKAKEKLRVFRRNLSCPL